MFIGKMNEHDDNPMDLVVHYFQTNPDSLEKGGWVDDWPLNIFLLLIDHYWSWIISKESMLIIAISII